MIPGLARFLLVPATYLIDGDLVHALNVELLPTVEVV